MAIASGKLWLNALSAYDSFQCNQIEIDPLKLVLVINQMILKWC